MAGTRQSARVAAQTNSSPPSATPSSGTKRKADADATSPTAKTNSKRGRPAKQQKTLEEVIPDEEKRDEVKEAVGLKDETEEDVGAGGDDEKAGKQDTNGHAGKLVTLSL